MPTASKTQSRAKTPKGMERLAAIVNQDCKRRSYEIALEMAKKQRTTKAPKSPK